MTKKKVITNVKKGVGIYGGLTISGLVYFANEWPRGDPMDPPLKVTNRPLSAGSSLGKRG